MDRSGIHIPFDLLQKATLYAPVCDYLFDFHSQGLITVRSFTTSSPWMSVGSCFLNCSDMFLAFSVIYSKFYLEIMANLVPVGQLTVAQAHQEFTKLVDQISAKFVQLDSGKFGAVGTLAFDAKMRELAVLFARMSQLCQRLGLSIPAHLHRPLSSSIKWSISAKFLVDHGLREASCSTFKNASRLLSASRQ